MPVPLLPSTLASSPTDRTALSGPALRTFFRIAARWGLSVDEQKTLLGAASLSTFYKWKRGPQVTLPPDTLERISYILGTYKTLQILLPNEQAADAWVRRPNHAPPFGGKSALERMLSGHVSDLYVVWQYLDAQRSSWV
jgi:Protein of unknown function (DUF2384)